MNSSTPSSPSRPSRICAWLFAPRILTRWVFAAACLLTLIAVYYTAENWRGKRAWEECRRELESRGATFDWAARIPDPVPDDQNIFKAPDMAGWFVKQHSEIGQSKELADRMAVVWGCMRRHEVLADVIVIPTNSSPSVGEAEVVLNQQPSPGAGFAAAELEIVGGLIQERLNASGSQGPSLKGSAGTWVFQAGSTNHASPFRVALRSSSPPNATEITALFESAAAAVGARARTQGRWQVESYGSNRFGVQLLTGASVDPADYLACSDGVVSVLDQIRNALKRPYARREGDYSNSWAVPLPNFVALRSVAQLLSQRAQCHLLLNQPEKALEELSLLHGLRRLLDGKPVTLVSAMIDVAISGLYSSTIADGLRLHAWQEPQLAALQQQLQELQLVPALLGAIDTERAASCHALLHTPASELDNTFALTQKPGFWSRITSPEYLLARWMPRGWVYQNMKSIALQDQWFIESTQTNYVVRPGLVEESSRKSLAALEGISPYNVLARIAMPNYLKAFQTTVRNQALVNEAYLACALERYRLAKTEYPPQLEILIPARASHLPVDPITGAALKYRRLEPDRFLLYSVGWNAIDDGGESANKTTEGDWVWEGAHS